ncbi:MAG TPA: FtsX-like permease family protein [Rhodanobacteraceae bacterium]|jgi:putative ABC transport system permease protein|nr:FtsX-like permease family protein [Rhodanobacteraceae bacterium]
MQIQPIVASLRKHRIPALLIVLEIALACAVLCNAVFMISQRVGEMHVQNAMDEQGIIDMRVLGTDPKLAHADIPRDLAALREIPGVTAVAAVNMVPLGQNSWNSNIATKPRDVMNKDNPNVAQYMFTRGGPEALGLRLVEGRFFNDGEYADSKLTESYLPSGHSVLVTESLAERLWPGESALGKQAWIGRDNSFTVVGVVADVLRPNRNGEGAAGFHWAMFFPLSPAAALNDYIVRSETQDRGRVLYAAQRKLEALSPNAVVKGKTFSDMRDQFFADTRSMVWMLVLVCVVMLAVTAFGIVGLTSFWVGQRRRQIGIRRAVGATRAHIMQYFQTENFMLSTAGVAIGMALAFGINLYLMQHYQTLRMPWYYLPASAVALWLLGQIAVLGPALRAANVPPVVATRGA